MPGINKPAKAKNRTPMRLKLFNGTNQRERSQKAIVPTNVVITVPERKFDSINPLRIKMVPKPNRKVPRRARNSDNISIHLSRSMAIQKPQDKLFAPYSNLAKFNIY